MRAAGEERVAGKRHARAGRKRGWFGDDIEWQRGEQSSASVAMARFGIERGIIIGRIVNPDAHTAQRSLDSRNCLARLGDCVIDMRWHRASTKICALGKLLRESVAVRGKLCEQVVVFHGWPCHSAGGSVAAWLWSGYGARIGTLVHSGWAGLYHAY